MPYFAGHFRRDECDWFEWVIGEVEHIGGERHIGTVESRHRPLTEEYLDVPCDLTMYVGTTPDAAEIPIIFTHLIRSESSHPPRLRFESR